MAHLTLKKRCWKPRQPPYPVRRASVEFDRMGKELEDIPCIRKKKSFRGIDDSGTPDFGPRSSEYLTLTAVTTLFDEDYSQMFDGISKYNGEVKFSILRIQNEEECLSVMRRLGQSTALILCYPRFKDPEHPRDSKEFFKESTQRLIDGIMGVDRSELIVIGIDDNPYLDMSDYYSFSSPRCIVFPADSRDSKLLQLADLSASSLGHALLPASKGSETYFQEIRENSVNVHGKPGVSTQQTPIGFNRDDIESATRHKNIGIRRWKHR